MPLPKTPASRLKWRFDIILPGRSRAARIFMVLSNATNLVSLLYVKHVRRHAKDADDLRIISNSQPPDTMRDLMGAYSAARPTPTFLTNNGRMP